MPLGIEPLYRLVFKIWRKQRFEMFIKLLRPKSTDMLLDVGGYPAFWASAPQPVKQIDSLNLHKVDWDNANQPEHNIRMLVGDGCALDMADGSYDIAFSNSVIEHVGSWENQERFAAEIRRVGRNLWVQTPAFECPIEPHYMTPLVHYLPRWLQRKTLRWCSVWGWLQRPGQKEIDEMVETTRLISKAEMRRLFPDCEIITERMLKVIPKSYIAIRRLETSA